MPFALPLSKKLAGAGWKVKIQDKESRETPHLTIWFKKKTWRISLRDGQFMDGGSWHDIDEEVHEMIRTNWGRLRAEWDDRYGEVNPIQARSKKMTTTSKKHRYVLLDPDKSQLALLGALDAWVCRTHAEILQVVRHASSATVWISCGPRWDKEFLRAVAGHTVRAGRLLALKPPRHENIPLLTGFFRGVFGMDDAFRFLPDEQLAEVLKSTQEEAKKVFIGGAVNEQMKVAGLIRGDVAMAVVPLSIFCPNKATKPDSQQLAFADYGQTVCLGDYEASSDSILYEIDPKYRSLINERRQKEDRAFGACFARLRRQKMLTQSDFAPLSRRTISRIERGATKQPRGEAMRIIRDKLGATLGEIKSY